MSKSILQYSVDRRLTQEISTLKRQIQELQANQAPSYLAVDKTIEVDQTSGVVDYKDENLDTIIKQGTIVNDDGSGNRIVGQALMNGTTVQKLEGKQVGTF